MLGPRVLASQTCGLSGLYDAVRRLVHGLPSWWLALSFLWLKSSISCIAVTKGHHPRLRKFTSKYPNPFLPVSCLLSMGVPLFFPLGMATRFPGQEFVLK